MSRPAPNPSAVEDQPTVAHAVPVLRPVMTGKGEHQNVLCTVDSRPNTTRSRAGINQVHAAAQEKGALPFVVAAAAAAAVVSSTVVRRPAAAQHLCGQHRGGAPGRGGSRRGGGGSPLGGCHHRMILPRSRDGFHGIVVGAGLVRRSLLGLGLASLGVAAVPGHAGEGELQARDPQHGAQHRVGEHARAQQLRDARCEMRCDRQAGRGVRGQVGSPLLPSATAPPLPSAAGWLCCLG
jgi:hypothetical protein